MTNMNAFRMDMPTSMLIANFMIAVCLRWPSTKYDVHKQFPINFKLWRPELSRKGQGYRPLNLHVLSLLMMIHTIANITCWPHPVPSHSVAIEGFQIRTYQKCHEANDKKGPKRGLGNIKIWIKIWTEGHYWIQASSPWVWFQPSAQQRVGIIFWHLLQQKLRTYYESTTTSLDFNWHPSKQVPRKGMAT